jgi:hypothetical protein
VRSLDIDKNSDNQQFMKSPSFISRLTTTSRM